MTTFRPRTTARGGSNSAPALRLLALFLGIFFLAQGLNKLGWFVDTTQLSNRFPNWLRDAAPGVRWYIETIAIPGAPLFARLVPLAELSTGVALVIGFWPRLFAAAAGVMVLNFHFALGAFYTGESLRDGALLPVVGGLLAIAIGGSRLPWSVRP
jgi:uncharacterized membrane protein YphA (DoxX/SURF4 family)